MGKSLLGKLGGIGVAIIVAIGFYFVQNKGEEKLEQAKAPDVGECVYLEKKGTEDVPVNAKCGSDKASHKVVGEGGNCGEGEGVYTVSASGTGKDAFVELCLVLDAKKGDCFDQNTENKVACADNKNSPTVFKISSVGKAGGKCANPGQPLEYPKRDILLCVVGNA